MKKMKRIAAMLACLMMVFSLATSAFATEDMVETREAVKHCPNCVQGAVHTGPFRRSDVDEVKCSHHSRGVDLYTVTTVGTEEYCDRCSYRMELQSQTSREFLRCEGFEVK